MKWHWDCDIRRQRKSSHSSWYCCNSRNCTNSRSGRWLGPFRSLYWETLAGDGSPDGDSPTHHKFQWHCCCFRSNYNCRMRIVHNHFRREILDRTRRYWWWPCYCSMRNSFCTLLTFFLDQCKLSKDILKVTVGFLSILFRSTSSRFQCSRSTDLMTRDLQQI